LAREGSARILADYVVAETWWQMKLAAAAGYIDEEHKNAPQTSGVQISILRRKLGRPFLDPEPWAAFLEDLFKRGYAQHSEQLQAKSHQIVLPDRLEPVCRQLRARFLDNPLQPLSISELAVSADSRAALRFLLQKGELVDLTPDLILSRLGFARIKTAVVRYLRQRQSATVSELRQASCTTRRVLVPLLEKLDRDGLTIREGDQRRLRLDAVVQPPEKAV
jgi:selenocysteine-specific elongation factor